MRNRPGGINVISLFNGHGGIWLALESIGIKVNKRYVSEIDKFPSQANDALYPDTIHLGDVTEWGSWDLTNGVDWDEIDLVVGGSPCQGFSVAGKGLAFEDPRSKLFFDFIKIRDKCKNADWMLENVRMKKEWLRVIDDYTGVKGELINSNLVSAQNRARYYWSNLTITQPEDQEIFLKDIVHEYFDNEKDIMRDKSCTIRVGGKGSPGFSKQEWDGVYNKHKLKDLRFNVNPSGKGMNGDVYSINKSRTLTTNKGEGQKVHNGLNSYVVPYEKTLAILNKETERGKTRKVSENTFIVHGRPISISEQVIIDTSEEEVRIKQATVKGYDVAQHGDSINFSNPNSKTRRGRVGKQKSNTLDTSCNQGVLLFGCITPDRVDKRQNGQRFNDGKKFYTLTAQDKHGILVEGYIRKLTPRECGRLQTVPEDKIDIMLSCGVSNSQLYKMFGNGWTVAVIAHILKDLKQDELW